MIKLVYVYLLTLIVILEVCLVIWVSIAKYAHKVVVGAALFDNLIMCIFVCGANCKFLFTVYQNTSYDHEQQPGALKKRGNLML